MSRFAAHSVSKTVPAVVDDLRSAWQGLAPRFIVYFASPALDPGALAAELKGAFPEAAQIGCTTAGELVSGKMFKGGVAALALPRELAGNIAVELVTPIRERPEGVVDALGSMAARFDVPVRSLSHEQHLGLVLIDGLSHSEERVMDVLGDACDVTFVGGSAGDDLQFRTTHVAVDGRAETNAAALALLKPPHGFDIMKTQSFRALDRRFVATRVDEATRTVIEFDGLPAADAYAAALAIPVAELPKKFMRHPVGLMVGNDPFVRSPMRVDDRGVVFYCTIKEGMELGLARVDGHRGRYLEGHRGPAGEGRRSRSAQLPLHFAHARAPGLGPDRRLRRDLHRGADRRVQHLRRGAAWPHEPDIDDRLFPALTSIKAD